MNNDTKIILLVTIPAILVMSSMIVTIQLQPSILNGHFGIDGIPEGVNIQEAKELKAVQDKCFEWNSSWSGNLKTGECDFDDKVIEPINFWENCGDLNQKYVYECESTSDGCIEGYVLVQDHWGSDMCYKQSHYDETLTYCSDKYGEFWSHEFTTSGFSCHKLSDSEILDVLLKERSENKNAEWSGD